MPIRFLKLCIRLGILLIPCVPLVKSISFRVSIGQFRQSNRTKWCTKWVICADIKILSSAVIIRSSSKSPSSFTHETWKLNVGYSFLESSQLTSLKRMHTYELVGVYSYFKIWNNVRTSHVSKFISTPSITFLSF